MIYIGIDPGASGGIAVYEDGHGMVATKMPETEADIALEFQSWKLMGPSKAIIEKVHAMPGQGVTSMFSFGKNYGFLRGCLISLGIPFDEVTPQTWQKALGCLTKGDKNVSKAKAQQLFPGIKVTHAIADSLLIAEYLRRRETGGL